MSFIKHVKLFSPHLIFSGLSVDRPPTVVGLIRLLDITSEREILHNRPFETARFSGRCAPADRSLSTLAIFPNPIQPQYMTPLNDGANTIVSHRREPTTLLHTKMWFHSGSWILAARQFRSELFQGECPLLHNVYQSVQTSVVS